MDIKYKFIPEFKSYEKKHKSDILSYAGKLLEILDTETALVTLNEDNVPVVYQIDSKMLNALDFQIEQY